MAVLVAVGLTCTSLLVAGIAGIASSFLGSGEDTTDYGVGATSSSYESASDTATSSSSSSKSSTTTAETTAEAHDEPSPVSALGDNPVNIAGGGARNTGCDLPPFDTSVGSQTPSTRPRCPA